MDTVGVDGTGSSGGLLCPELSFHRSGSSSCQHKGCGPLPPASGAAPSGEEPHLP